MYNPHHLHVCQQERRRNPRAAVDHLMTAVGVAASFASLPQVVQIWRTRVVDGISLPTYLIAMGAVIAWFWYGLFIRNKPLVYTTAASIIVNAIVIVQLLLYKI